MPPEPDPSPLARNQQALLAAIIDGAAPEDLLAGSAAARARGLQVYRHAYLARLREALADNYSVFARALGDQRFARLADRYAAVWPPAAASLRPYGEHLDRFLASDPKDADGTPLLPHPALRDLARMDRALRDAFDATDCVPLQAGDLAAVPPDAWPDLQFQLLPSARRITLDWAVEDAWHAIQRAAPGEEPELEVPEAHPHALLVWRPAGENRWRSLVPEEDALLEQIARGQSFAGLGDWLAALRGDSAEASAALVAWLQQWLADGCLTWRSGSETAGP